jgi:hypothetical protein
MNRSYAELGGYGTLSKSQNASPLNDLSGMFGNMFNSFVEGGAKLLGITKEDEVATIVKDLVKDVGSSYIDAATDPNSTEAQKQAAKDAALKEADAILSQYKNMSCDTMTDDQKQAIAASLSQFTSMFQQLGMMNKLTEVIKKYNVPNDCALPAKSSTSSTSVSMLAPAAAGIATGGVAYMVLKPVCPSTTVRLLASATAGLFAGKYTYSYINKDKDKKVA